MNEFGLRDELKEERKNIATFDDLINFLRNVKDNYNCEYDEAPRAIAQATLAVAEFLSNEFGTTRFQDGVVMWDFIRDWLYDGNECGMSLIDYDNMLYPQYTSRFQKTIKPDTFKALQKKAKKLIETDGKHASPRVIEHWKSIVAGEVPFGYVVRESCVGVKGRGACNGSDSKHNS